MNEKYQRTTASVKDSSHEKILDLDTNLNITTKVYKLRWLILALFMFYVALTTFQFVQYAIVTNIITRYYGVTPLAVNWTSMTFMLFHVIFAYPANYLTNRIGLRWSTVLGSLLNFSGTWIKVFSVAPDRFYITFVGQCLVAMTQAFVMSGPGTIAAQWFPSNEASTATSVCLLGNLIGLSAGFLFTPMMIGNHEDLSNVGIDLLKMFTIVAVLSTISLATIIIFFENEPPHVPSITRAYQKTRRSINDDKFMEPLYKLIRNKNFVLLCNSYGIIIGILNANATLLNQLVLARFENAQKDAGGIGLSIIVSGMFGSVVIGIIVDKTKKFKIITVAVCFLILCGQIFFAVSLLCSVKWIVYVAAIFMGTFMSAYISLGYEICAEFTYPEPEATANAILNIMTNVYGVIMVLIIDTLLQSYGDLSAHLAMSAALLLGFFIIIVTKDKHRRLDARNAALYQSVDKSNNVRILTMNENYK